jgi:hypothetical protein
MKAKRIEEVAQRVREASVGGSTSDYQTHNEAREGRIVVILREFAREAMEDAAMEEEKFRFSPREMTSVYELGQKFGLSHALAVCCQRLGDRIRARAKTLEEKEVAP